MAEQDDAALVADARRRIDLSMFGDNWGRADRILICATIRRLLALADEAIRLREEVEKLRAVATASIALRDAEHPVGSGNAGEIARR